MTEKDDYSYEVALTDEQWKDFIKSMNLNDFLRNAREILKRPVRRHIDDWRTNSLKATNNKCMITGLASPLEVHHIHSYDSIWNEVIEEIEKEKINDDEWTSKKEILYPFISEDIEKQLKYIKIRFLEKHESYGLGAPLHAALHSEFHRIYYRGGNTKEQFEEFLKYCDKEKVDFILKHY